MNREEALAVARSMRAQADALEAYLLSLASNDAPLAAPAPASTPVPTAGLQKPEAFYSALRVSNLFGPTISESELAGCEAILKACAGVYPMSWAAYALATAWLETGSAMQPVKEANWLSPQAADRYFTRMYDIEGDRPAKARELGNTSPGDGAKYAGRGYVQMTGKANYIKATTKLRERDLDVDLIEGPDLAMRPDVAAIIMVDGMKEGWFTGRKLRDYIPANPTRQHFRNARRVINGTDRADDIAGAAEAFQFALKAGAWA